MSEQAKQNDGGPAFPVYTHNLGEGAVVTDCGTTLRDYFAAKAMQGLVSDYTAMRDALEHCGRGELSPSSPRREKQRVRHLAFQRFADHAYAIADAMLAARAKPEPK